MDIEKLLNSLGLNQREFAEKLGLSQSNISEWKKGRSSPTFKILKDMNKLFGISVDWLLTGEGEMFLDKESSSQVNEKTTPYHIPETKQMINTAIPKPELIDCPSCSILLSENERLRGENQELRAENKNLIRQAGIAEGKYINEMDRQQWEREQKAKQNAG